MATSLEVSKIFLLSLPQELTQIREKLQEQEYELKRIIENLSLDSTHISSPNVTKNESHIKVQYFYLIFAILLQI